MKTLHLDKNGLITIKHFTRSSFCALFKDINTRDLRPVFSTMQVSTILPRDTVLIINLGFIKCVITPKSVYFTIHNNSDEVEAIIKKIQIKLQNKNEDLFVLTILEALFDAKISQLKIKVSDAEKRVNIILKKIRTKFHESDLEKLLILKKHLSRLETRNKEILSATEEVLDDKEDFDQILSLTNNDQVSGDELESIFDNFLEQLENTDGIIFGLEESIEDNEEFVNLTLNVRRTSFIQLNLMATLFTLILSLLAVIVGLYGVNLKNGLENNLNAFHTLSSILFAIFIILTIALFIYLKKKNLF